MIARLTRPRNRELVNLLLVGLLVVTGFGAVFIARENAVSTASLSYAAFFIGLYGVAHIVLRFALPRADPYLLPLVALLAAIGEVEIYRINPTLARDQGLWIIVGLLVFSVVVFAFRDIRKLEGLRYTCGAAAVLLLMATVVLGTEVNGAKLWIRFGGYQIQPGEFAKVLLVVFIAGYLRENREVLERPSRRVMGVGLPALRHLLPLLAMWGIALVLLVVVNDFGSSLLYYSILLAMLYIATGRWLYVGGGIRGVRGRRVRRRARRAARAGPHRHLDRSVGHVADDGLPDRAVPVLDRRRRHLRHGLRPGLHLVGKHTVIPDAQTDFIFSVIASETGSAGAAGLLLVYLAFVYRGMKIASMADDGFTKLLAAGCRSRSASRRS